MIKVVDFYYKSNFYLMVCMHAISIQFKIDAMSFNILNKMELNLNKIKFYQYIYIYNYEPPKS